jgi:hypothetical protein
MFQNQILVSKYFAFQITILLIIDHAVHITFVHTYRTLLKAPLGLSFSSSQQKSIWGFNKEPLLLSHYIEIDK